MCDYQVLLYKDRHVYDIQITINCYLLKNNDLVGSDATILF